MVLRRRFPKRGEIEEPSKSPISSTQPTLIKWSRNPDAWRLRAARLSLRTTNAKSSALRAVIQQEHIERECQELERLRRVLLSDATLARNDAAVLRMLGMRVAAFYKRVGELERRIELFSDTLRRSKNQ